MTSSALRAGASWSSSSGHAQLAVAAHDLGQQPLLGPEVVVQQPAGHARLARDVVERRARHAAPRDARAHGLDDALGLLALDGALLLLGRGLHGAQPSWPASREEAFGAGSVAACCSPRRATSRSTPPAGARSEREAPSGPSRGRPRRALTRTPDCGRCTPTTASRAAAAHCAASTPAPPGSYGRSTSSPPAAPIDLARDYGELVEGLEAGLIREPDEAGVHDDGFLAGRCGALAVAQRHRDDAARADLLVRLIAEQAEHPALDLVYGAPGTMLLATAEHARTGDLRFADAWQVSAERVRAAWRIDDELGVRLWTQELSPGRTERSVGFGHGFAGNAFALLHGPDPGPADRRTVESDAVATATRLAVVEGDRANWPVLAGAALAGSGAIRTQRCHGAPGMIIALAAACPDDDAWTELLLAGGQLTWDAGPLRDRVGLCHGTAGNAYALLALWQRTADELWLERARRLAMHALGQVERRATPWHSLFTGDLGVALCPRSCLEADPRFPALGWF